MDDFVDFLMEISSNNIVDDKFEFLGFELVSMCDSNPNKKNKIYEYSEKLKDKSISFEKRFEGLRYLQRIPHKDSGKLCKEVCKSILDDDNISLFNKFYMFSNNDAYMKLDYYLVNYCFDLLYKDFFCSEKSVYNLPLEYKILVSKFVLQYYQLENFDVNKLQKYLLDISKDVNNSINIRADCCDTLISFGYNNPMYTFFDCKKEARQVLDELSLEDSFVSKYVSVYNNSQNIHDKTINSFVIKSLINLINNTSIKYNMDNIYSELLSLDNSISSVIQRIMIDTSKYQGKRLNDVLMMVWERIEKNASKDELKKILIEEMKEMDGSCSTGYLSRLINTLSGFDELIEIKIDINQEIRSSVYARLNNMLSKCDFSDNVIDEMKNVKEDLVYIPKFIKENEDVIEEIYSEYSDAQKRNIDKIVNEYFNIIYPLEYHDEIIVKK